MLANGATTLWEGWGAPDRGSDELAQPPHVGIGQRWFYKYLAGINPDPRGPGSKVHPETVPCQGVRLGSRGVHVDVRRCPELLAA